MNPKPVELGMARLGPHGTREETAMNEAPLLPVDQPPPAAAEVNLSPEQVEQLRARIIDVLHTVFDPELPVNIYELGLVYDLIIQPNGAVNILMTLTSPACPVAGALPGDVERKVRSVANVSAVKVDLVWDPPWDKDRMTEAAKLQLGLEDW
jgi:FeS assembly SUF system protein